MPQDWFAQNAPPPAPTIAQTAPQTAGQDWFMQNAPPQQGAGTSGMQQPEGSGVGRFFSNLWDKSAGAIPSTIKAGADLAVQGARAAYGQPIDPTGPGGKAIQGIAQGHIDQAKKTAASVSKAVDAITKGDYKGALNHYTEAFGHAAATAVPIIGPAAASIGEQAGGEEGDPTAFDRYGNPTRQSGREPDIAGAAGGAAGMIGSTVAPRAIGKVAGVAKDAALDAIKVPSTLNPVEQSAVDYARGENIPLSPGTITGNKFLQSQEALTQNRPFGATAGAEFRRSTEAGLRRVGGELTEQAKPGTPATPESAGQAVKTQVTNQAEIAKAKAAEAYGDFQQAVRHPSATRTVQQQLSDGTQVDQAVQAPVDMRGIKDALEPQYNSMSKWMQPALKNSSAGFQAIKSILEGPDYLPAEEAEHGLSGLKDLARGGDAAGADPSLHAALRDVNQGIGAHATKLLQDQIDGAVADAGGQGALEALQRGRAATASKVEIGELADKLRQEPVQTFKQLTWQHDTGIDFLRKVADQAPDQMPGIGRAWVQQSMDQAMREGGFSKTQGLLNDFRNLGPETQKILFPDPQLRSNLGNFFKTADMAAHAPNPSGTALVAGSDSWNPGKIAAGWLGSKMLFTPKGISLLTDSLAPRSAGAAALTQARIRAMAQQPTGGNGGTGGTAPPPTGGTGGISADDLADMSEESQSRQAAQTTSPEANHPDSSKAKTSTPYDPLRSGGAEHAGVAPGSQGSTGSGPTAPTQQQVTPPSTPPRSALQAALDKRKTAIEKSKSKLAKPGQEPQ